MSDLTQEQVEGWLDDHPEVCFDYFLRKTELPVINAWLVTHGFSSVTPFVPPDINDNRPFAVSFRRALSRFSAEVPTLSSLTTQRLILGDGQSPSTSKTYLRQDFAKSRTMFKTLDPSTSEPPGSRRDSYRDLRKCTSLPPTSVSLLSALTESKVKLPKGFPFLGKAVKQNIRQTKGEKEFFLSIVRDIATELDIAALCGKAVENLTVLMNSEAASLFLVEKGPEGRPTLVAKNWRARDSSDSNDPPGESDFPEVSKTLEISVPFGKGILGLVAQSGETVNLRVASEDPRFDKKYDNIAGFTTESLLCMPVRNARDEIIAVSQIVNKNKMMDDGHFTDNDVSALKTYLQFIGIAITNARIIDASRQEYERNRNLLEVVHDLYEQQTSLENVMIKIIQRVQKLIECAKASILVLKDISDSAHARLFELSSHSRNRDEQTPQEKERARAVTRYMAGAAQKVLASGKILNIGEVAGLETELDGLVRNVLAMPIRNSRYEIIGVAVLLDKINDLPFDKNDEQLLEVFAIFCGLGIHNTLMFSEIEKAVARQKVALEVLSYHATASTNEVEIFTKEPIPCADDFNLYSLSFDDFSLDPDQMVRAAASMFLQLGLMDRFNIEKATLYRFLASVRKNYRRVPYHNWRHAFSVAQFMFAIFMACEMKDTFSELEVLAMFVGCLCHDLDHRGTNNAFQQKSGSPLVLLYGTTNTMEHHHFNHAVMILSAEGNNIFSGLSPYQYSKVIEILKHSILATDLSVYFENRARFFELVKTRTYSWELDDHRELLRSMLMTASDLAASCKPWEVQKRVAQLVTSEFFEQGDKERDELHLTPQPLMDRERRHELPQLQIDWMTDICIPLYESLGEMNPKFSPMCEGAIENRKQWQRIVDEKNTMIWDESEENP